MRLSPGGVRHHPQGREELLKPLKEGRGKFFQASQFSVSPRSQPSSPQSPGQKHAPPPPPTPRFRMRIPRAGPSSSNDSRHLAPFFPGHPPGLPRGWPHYPHRPSPPIPRPPPPRGASRSDGPSLLPSPHRRFLDPAVPRARSRPGPGRPLCSSLTGPRFGLSGPSGRSSLSVRCRIGGCGPRRGIGPGLLFSASRAASSHGCHLRTPPRPTEPEPRPGPDGNDVTMGPPAPGLDPQSSAHWRTRGEGWGPVPGRWSVILRGPPETRGGEASSPTGIWALDRKGLPVRVRSKSRGAPSSAGTG